MALVSPTGFGRNTPERAPPGTTRAMPTLHKVVSFPLWSRALFDLLTSKPSIRYFLQKTWGSKRIDEGLLEYDYLTTHQPGAQHAPYAFVSGFLFSGDISNVYCALELPIWMSHGVRGDFTDYSWARSIEHKSNWVIHEFPTGALSYFEMTGLFVQRYETFLERVVALRGGRKERL